MQQNVEITTHNHCKNVEKIHIQYHGQKKIKKNRLFHCQKKTMKRHTTGHTAYFGFLNK